MKKIICLSFIILCFGCYELKNDCAQYRNGQFIFKQTINNKEEVTHFERKGNLQIEHYKGTTDTASVRWVNDCEMIIEKLHPKNSVERKAIVIKIIQTDGKGYHFTYGFVGNNTTQKGYALLKK